MLKPARNLPEFFLYFMGLYTHLEQFLGSMLMQETRMDYADYVIIVGNQRTTDIISKLEKLFKRKIKYADVIDQSKIAFKQLRKLTDLRDRLVHSGAVTLESGEIQVSMRLHMKSDVTGGPHDLFSIEQLNFATEDLNKIYQFLVFHLIPMALPPAELAMLKSAWTIEEGAWQFQLPTSSPRDDL